MEIENDHSYIIQSCISKNCQDLSLAGQRKGMTKGNGTRSGLLWEVERLLSEMKELPQILLMENVPQVHGKKNKQEFNDWCNFLESLGYKNYWQDLNAKDYGIPQNRNRCFMVSILGDYYYSFPKPQKLQVRLKDFLDKKVDEKYYLSDKTVEMFIEHTRKQQEKGNGFKFEPTDGNYVGKCITTREGSRGYENFILDKTDGVMLGTSERFNAGLCKVMSRSITTQGKNGVVEWDTEVKIAEPIIYDDYNSKIRTDQDCIGTLTTNCGISALRNGFKIIEPNYRFFEQAFETLRENTYEVGDTIDAFNKRVNKNGISPTITTRPDGFKTAILPITQDYRIRKLTEKECFRLMGVKEQDFEKASKNQSMSSLFHLAGDSICVSVLMAIFGSLFTIPNYNNKITDLVNKLKQGD